MYNKTHNPPPIPTLDLIISMQWINITWIYRQGTSVANIDINYWSVRLSISRKGDKVKGVNGGYRYFI